MKTRNLAAAALLALFPAAPSFATSCWNTPHTFSADVVTVGQLNEMTANDACNHTEINSDGTITRDVVGFASVSALGNSGGTPTTVNSWTMPANTLNTNGESLEVTALFACAANGNTKTVEFLLGSQTVTASSSACNATGLLVRLTVMRITATSEHVFGTVGAAGLGGSNLFGSEAFTQNLATSLAVGFKLTGTSNNDLVQKWVRVTNARY